MPFFERSWSDVSLMGDVSNCAMPYKHIYYCYCKFDNFTYLYQPSIWPYSLSDPKKQVLWTHENCSTFFFFFLMLTTTLAHRFFFIFLILSRRGSYAPVKCQIKYLLYLICNATNIIIFFFWIKIKFRSAGSKHNLEYSLQWSAANQ